MSPTLARSVAAEFLGTALLVFVAVGSAVAGIDAIGEFGVAFAFGLTLLALAYAIGPISGCHINPAVTLGVLLSRGMTTTEAAYYWVAQFAGGIAGAAVLQLLTSGFGDMTDQTGALGANDYGATISLGGALVLEVLLTFVFVAVILLVTGKAAAPGLRRPGDRADPHGRPPDRHPAHRDVGQPGALARPGAVRRRRAARPRVAVHRRAAHRCSASRSPSSGPSPSRSSRPGQAAATADETGAQLPPEEQPVQIPPPATDPATTTGADRRTPPPDGWSRRAPACAGGAVRAVWRRVAPTARRAGPARTGRRPGAAAGGLGCRRTITPYRDGPLIVRGDFRLVDQDGAEIDPGRRDDRALPVREVGHQAVLRRHAQAVGFLRAQRTQPAAPRGGDPARGRGDGTDRP